MTLKLHTKLNAFGKGIFLKMKTAWKVILYFGKCCVHEFGHVQSPIGMSWHAHRLIYVTLLQWSGCHEQHKVTSKVMKIFN
jgi:hypothetical protein